jgi:hypothetical protein
MLKGSSSEIWQRGPLKHAIELSNPDLALKLVPKRLAPPCLSPRLLWGFSKWQMWKSCCTVKIQRHINNLHRSWGFLLNFLWGIIYLILRCWSTNFKNSSILYFFFFCSSGDCTQGFILARQAFYCLSRSTSPFCTGYFGDKVLLFCPAWPGSPSF